VILSWLDIETEAVQAYNVVIHQFAQKLHMLNGAAYGMPPLHRGKDAKAWTRDLSQTDLSQTYEDLNRQLARDETTASIDIYAAGIPGSFCRIKRSDLRDA
jgi:Mlc titration factor MtfA (ptsG expression regulator)